MLPPAAAAVAADTRRSVTMEEETNSKTEEEKEERIPEDVERKIMENINRKETRRKGSDVHQYKNRFHSLRSLISLCTGGYRVLMCICCHPDWLKSFGLVGFFQFSLFIFCPY